MLAQKNRGEFRANFLKRNESKMIKQILILLILLVICFWGKANNNGNDSFHGDIPGPAVRNSLKYNYDQIAGIKNNEKSDYSDDFNLPQLRSLWQTNIKETDWTLRERPGFLRIKAQKNGNVAGIEQENTFSQKLKYNTSCEVVSSIDLTNFSVNSNAGLYFHSKTTNYIGVETNEGKKILVVSINNKILQGPEIIVNSVLFRIKIENYCGGFEYSFDGLNYVKFGADFKLGTLSNDNDRIGFYCFNSNNESCSIDIDWFYYNQRSDNQTKFAEVENKILYPEL
jgi:beta-xylosidase